MVSCFDETYRGIKKSPYRIWNEAKLQETSRRSLVSSSTKNRKVSTNDVTMEDVEDVNYRRLRFCSPFPLKIIK